MSCAEGMVADKEGAEKMCRRVERAKVAERLRNLELGGGSHENLSAICGAIYDSDWGWTRGACEALREKLVWLLGECG